MRVDARLIGIFMLSYGYSFALNCRVVILKFLKILTPCCIYRDLPPILANYGCHHYQQNFTFTPTLHQALPNVCQVEHCLLRLAPYDGTIQSFSHFRVVSIFPVGHFITTPPLYENLEKYPPTCYFDLPKNERKRAGFNGDSHLNQSNDTFCR